MCKNCEDEFWKSIKDLKDVKGFYKIVKPLGDKPYEDLSNKKFGKLTAVGAVGRNKSSRVLWLCKCSCGNSIITTASDLKANQVKSCGCLSKEPKFQNLEGKVFTRWTVTKDEGGDKVFCRCECGTERWVDRGNLRGGGSTSCGCLRKEELSNKYRKVAPGQVYGRLTIKRLIGRNKHKKLIWEAECSCGNVITVTSDLIRSGSTRSCGCLQKELTTQRCTKPMIGKTFGRLTVLEKAYTKKGKGAYYKCRCSCGNIVTVQGSMLRSKNSTSCGCYNRERTSETAFKDLTGQRFGKLVVVERADDLIQENGRRRVRFLCKCDCGGTIITTSSSLVSRETMSCGCMLSKGEFLIAQTLSKNNVAFEKQKSFNDLRGKTKNSVLRYDFYITSENYLIEYDGQHHFIAGGGWCSEDHVKETQERDRMKDDYCRRKGIPLIRIPYTHIDEICLDDLKIETTKFRIV